MFSRRLSAQPKKLIDVLRKNLNILKKWRITFTTFSHVIKIATYSIPLGLLIDSSLLLDPLEADLLFQ